MLFAVQEMFGQIGVEDHASNEAHDDQLHLRDGLRVINNTRILPHVVLVVFALPFTVQLFRRDIAEHGRIQP